MVTQTTNVPQAWLARGGSEPEYLVYVALLRTGRREPADFQYQAKIAGGSQVRGGAIPDFLIESPRMAINVQSRYFHSRTANQRSHDQQVRLFLEGSNLRVAYISEDQARQNADFFVRRALSQAVVQGPIGVLQ